jgi:hypothetical protein
VLFGQALDMDPIAEQQLPEPVEAIAALSGSPFARGEF